MPIWAVFIGRFWYLPVMAALAGVATYYHIDRDHVQASWQARWDARDKAEWQAAYQVEQAHREALEAADARNVEILRRLNDKVKEAAGIQHDLDLARRLLAAATAGSGVGPVPQDPAKPGTAGAGQAGGNEGIGERLAAAFTECRQNADQLDALIAEITGQK